MRIVNAIRRYGPIPNLDGVSADALVSHLAKDKKTIQGAVHFVLPVRIGEAKVIAGIEEGSVLEATRIALEEPTGL